jgi:hypothetical protein
MSLMLFFRKTAMRNEHRKNHFDAVKANRRIKCARMEYSGFVLAALVCLTFSKIPSRLFQNDKESLMSGDRKSKADQMTQLSYYPSLPNEFPWHRHIGGPCQFWNFSSFWELAFMVLKGVNKPQAFAHNASASESGKILFYCVKNGTLFRSRKKPSFLSGRQQTFEDMTSSSLELARRVVESKQDQHIDPRFIELTTNPFPFFMHIGDFWSCGKKRYPMFSFSSFKEEETNEKCIPVAVPTYEHWKNGKNSSAEWDLQFDKQNKKYRWETKINKAIWRGSATGVLFKYPYWQDLPRAKLVKFSIENPTAVDAGFKGASQRNKTELHEMESMGFVKNRMKMEDFQKFKAVIDIDGNSWSSRFFKLMCMNSVVLKVQPNHIDYFYHELQPWVHYLPVHGNLSNLMDMVSLAISADEEKQQQMQYIVKNANNWCKQKGTFESMSLDMSWIMTSYLEILKKESLKSGALSKWKDVLSNKDGWNDEDWVEITPIQKKKLDIRM